MWPHTEAKRNMCWNGFGFFFGVFFKLLKVLPHCITCACWDSGRPLAGVVTPYLVLDTGLIAYITPGLTGGVVAVRCYWMAAVQTTCTDTGVVQNWTLHSWGRIKKENVIVSVKAGILCTYKLVLDEYGQKFRNRWKKTTTHQTDVEFFQEKGNLFD